MQAFISYKSEYQNFARHVRDTLKSWGHDTWFDADDIPKGRYFRHEIQQGLENSDVVIGIVTPEAVQSREVMTEWDYAFSGNSRLLLLIHQKTDLPYHLTGIQYIDFTKNEVNAFTQLQSSLLTSDVSRYEKQEAPTKAATKTQQSNREIMLQKVHDFWVKGVLHNALGESTSLAIDIASAPGAVLKHRQYEDYQLPETALAIDKIFKDMQRELLILGAPGSGKTIVLLQLAEKLIAAAQADEKLAIPIIFNLSSWAAERKTLKDWIIDELNSKYQVSKKIAKNWIEYEKILPLLDGLDEVVGEHRDACVDAINDFREAYRSVDLAICSRIEEYEALSNKLDLQGAMTLQALSEEQIEGYLAENSYQTLRDTMQKDSTLQNIAHTPFLLNTMAYAYQDASPPTLALPPDEENEDGRIKHLFENYVETRIKNDSSENKYTPRETRHYLSWLARKLHQHQLTVFYIENLNFAWAQESYLRWYKPIGLLAGTFIGAIIGALVGYGTDIVSGLLSVSIPIDAFIGATVGIIIGWYSTHNEKILPAETITWRWTWQALAIGLSTGILIGTVAYFIAITMGLDSIRFFVGLYVGILISFSVVFGMGIHSSEYVQARSSPNHGIRLTIENSIGLCLISGVVIGFAYLVGLMMIVPLISVSGGVLRDNFIEAMKLVFDAGYINLILAGIAIASASGLFIGIVFGGGIVVVKHIILRVFLFRGGDIPPNYAEFLDHAANDLHILRKVGGGYIFRHRYLLEYFAGKKLE